MLSIKEIMKTNFVNEIIPIFPEIVEEYVTASINTQQKFVNVTVKIHLSKYLSYDTGRWELIEKLENSKFEVDYRKDGFSYIGISKKFKIDDVKTEVYQQEFIIGEKNV